MVSNSKALILTLLTLLLIALIHTAAQEKRPYKLDDSFSSEDIGDISFSPDGQILAYVRARPRNSLAKTVESAVWLSPREDIWLQDRPGQPARKITDGEKDSSKWWEPAWSPDAKRLAFLSTRGGNITLWVWERSTNSIRQASTQGVSVGNSNFSNSIYWVDSHRILFLAPPTGRISRPETTSAGLNVSTRGAEDAWERARQGDVTASAVSSTEFRYPERSIVLLDLESGKERRIAMTIDRHAMYPDYWPSPDARFLALASPVSTPYNLMSNFRMGFPHTVELRTIEGEPVRLDKPLPQNIHTQTIKWSPDGKELAFFANGPGSFNSILLYGMAAAEAMPQEEWKAPMDNPAKLYRVNIEKKTVEEIGTADIDLGYLGAPDFLWTATGELIFNAPKKQPGRTAGPDPSRGAPWGWGAANAPLIDTQPPKEWLVLDRGGHTRSLAKNLPKIQGTLRSINGGRELLGLSDGEVISVDSSTGDIKNLTAGLSEKVGSIYGVPGGRDGALITANTFAPNVSKIVITKQGNSPVREMVLTLKTGKTMPLSRPSSTAQLRKFSQETDNAAYLADDINGLFLWRVTSGEIELLAEANKYWQGITKTEARVIEYTGLDGTKGTGTIRLPYDYKPNRRYPVVVSVYPERLPSLARVGPVVDSDPPIHIRDTYTAQGYVLFEPSLKANPTGRIVLPGGRHAEEPASCQYMTNGVLPAVDRLIEMGIADPDRLFIQGGSWGGWATLCILGHTTRFKAAVARSMGVDGDYGNGPLRQNSITRYSDNPADYAGPVNWILTFTNVPWWRDGDRLRMNNPITYADRIQTPLMLIHGDLDGTTPIELSERFFNALVTMRKPAEFVRYWGEFHGNRSPANIRDQYMRTFAWYDRWGNLARDEQGNMVWDGDRVKGRNGAPPLKPEDYAKFDSFQPSPARRELAVGSKQ